MIRLIPLLLLAGCAGYSAMQWRPPAPQFCGVKVCVAKIGESKCKPEDFKCSGKTASQVLRELGL